MVRLNGLAWNRWRYVTKNTYLLNYNKNNSHPWVSCECLSFVDLTVELDNNILIPTFTVFLCFSIFSSSFAFSFCFPCLSRVMLTFIYELVIIVQFCWTPSGQQATLVWPPTVNSTIILGMVFQACWRQRRQLWHQQ